MFGKIDRLSNSIKTITNTITKGLAIQSARVVPVIELAVFFQFVIVLPARDI